MGSLDDLTHADWQRLLSHVGYGNPWGSLWFLGIEEGLKGEPDHDLRWRLKNLKNPVDTVTTLHGGNVPPTYTWRLMAKIARLLVDRADNWSDGDLAKNYVRDLLGSESGDTFLFELLPLPSRSTGSFPYAFRYRGGRKQYMEEVLPDREVLLREFVRKHRPPVVICYGTSYWDRFRHLFPMTSPRTENVPVNKGVTTTEMGKWEDTTVVLTPFFVPYRFPVEAVAHLSTLVALPT